MDYKKFSLNILINLIVALVVGALSFFGTYYFTLGKLETEISNIKSQITELKNDKNKLSDKIVEIEKKLEVQDYKISNIPIEKATRKKLYTVSGSKLTIDLNEFEGKK